MRSSNVLLLLAGVLIGAAMAHGYNRWQSPETPPSHWIELDTSTSPTFTTEALFEADIPLPKIGTMSGRAKFVPGTGAGNAKLGYIVEVPVPPLDPSDVPDRYKRRVPHPDGSVTLPLNEVYYEVEFVFSLRDKDGFEVMQLGSAPHSISSNQRNSIQSVSPGQIPVSGARRVESIAVKLHVTKCASCRTDEG